MVAMSALTQRVLGFVVGSMLALNALPAAAEQTSAAASTTASVAADPPVVHPVAEHDRVVSDVPAAWTPQLLDGRTTSVAQTGSWVVVGGTFSRIAPSSGSPQLDRSGVAAFDATTGAINTSFAPSVSNGQVRAVEPGPTPGTVYIAGAFQGINGVNDKVILMDVATGNIVSSFNAPPMNGAVNDMTRVGDRLYVGGAFSVVGGASHKGLVSLDANSGARQDFLSVQLTENHNYTGQPGQARAAVQAKAIAATPQGDQLAVIGNFRKADGLERRQMVLIDLTGSAAAVRDDWRTDRYAPACFNWAFDTYVRDVTSSPDGSHFLVASTGGPNPGTLCDTLSRWDTDATGQDVQPAWVDDTGGDTLLSVASSGAAAYTGGHQRWQNNHGGRDFPAAGAVPRPGLAGIDVDTGLPLAWNPGRSPRGVGAEAAYVTEAGLWIGSDTEQIGHHRYRRPRIAFFPVDGGTVLGDGATGSLASNVYVGPTTPGAASGTSGEALYRINAGGPGLDALDGGPAWMGDDGTSSPYRNSGSNSSPWPANAATIDGTVPASTPAAVFDSERWDPGARDDSGEMTWALPVPDGTQVDVRLYLANRCDCTSAAGQRVFDVMLEGNPVLTSHDMVADVGDQVATMKSFTVTSDGTIDLQWLHRIENPVVNGIEIIEHLPGEQTPETRGFSRVWYEGGPVVETPESAPAGDMDWSKVHGAVVIDGELFYGTSDNQFLRRDFDGTSYGPATAIDPYNDSYWSDINTGSGQTFRGVQPSFYSQISSLTGMAYDEGRLYYTRAGRNSIFSRVFSPDSGVMSQEVREIPDFAPANLGGIFLDEGGKFLYYSNSVTGTLTRVGWTSNGTAGESVVVSGPTIDGMDWRSRAMFLAGGPTPAANEPPKAVMDISCERLECSFDATGSSDDSSVASYRWDFGDGQVSSDAVTNHTYAEGTHTVTLTVTDGRGAIGTASTELEVVKNAEPVAQIAEPTCDGLECSFDGSTSSDADDSIVSYEWDFGDGSAPMTEAAPTHTFTGPGTYTVSLTVTDEFDAQGTATVQLKVLANQPPVAVVGEPVCDVLKCAFDGSGSSDPDSGDSVAGYSWDFGDGSPKVEGVDPSHSYDAAGTYTVTLTVVDEQGASASVTYDVTVSDAAEPGIQAPQLVGQAAQMSQQTTTSRVSVPEEVQAGDLLVLFVSTNSAGEGSGPTGVGDWQEHERVLSGPLAASVFTRVADGSEADSEVTMQWPGPYRTDMSVVVYRGVSTDGAEALETAVDRNTDTHTTPTVTAQGEARVALSFWADRSSSTTAWTPPDDVDVVSTSIGTGGGRVTTMLAAQSVSAGPYGGLVATTDAPASRAVTITLLLPPVQDTP